MVARAGVPVRGDHVGEAASQQRHGRLLDLEAVVAEQRADVHLRHRSGREQPPQRLVAGGRADPAGALGVCQHDPEAARGDRRAVGLVGLVDAAEGRLDQQPAAAGRALRDQLELGVRELVGVARVELAAGTHAHTNAVAFEQRGERRGAFRDRADLQWPIPVDVRRHGDVAYSLCGKPSRVRERR